MAPAGHSHSAHQGQEKLGAIHCIQKSGTIHLFPLLLLYSIGFATIFPVVPTLVTNGFASQAIGHYIDCQRFTPATSPPECTNAHAQAVTWNSWTSFVSGSILTFLCSPIVGRLSDHYGRKPFVVAGISLSMAPMVMLMLFIWGWTRIEWYYLASASNGVISSFSLAVMMVADLLHQCHRATAIGYLSACFSIGILIGPILGGYLSNQAAVYFCIVMIGFTLLYLIFVLPETAPAVVAKRKGQRQTERPADRESLSEPLLGASSSGSVDAQCGVVCHEAAVAVLGEMDFDPIPNVVPHQQQHTVVAPAQLLEYERHHQDQSCHGGKDAAEPSPAAACQPCAQPQGRQGPGSSGCADQEEAGQGSQGPGVQTGSLKETLADMAVGWRIIKDSVYYRKLVVIMVIVAMTWEGAQDMLMQYLQLTLGFTTKDQAHLLVMVATIGLVIKVVFLAKLVSLLGEQWLLFVGLTAYFIQDLLLANASTKLTALMSVGVGAMSCVAWPASMALQTRHADPRHVGAIQGALSSVSSMASGVGPVAFAAIFSAFSRTDSKMPFYPQVVWYVAALLTVMALALTATLHWGVLPTQQEQVTEKTYQKPTDSEPSPQDGMLDPSCSSFEPGKCDAV